MSRLHDKVALVTGGSRGIGGAIARRLAADGARVCIAYRSRWEAAAKTISAVCQGGGEGFAIEIDAATASGSAEAAREAFARWGRIDILVNNAGKSARRALSEVDEEYFHSVMNNNVLSVITTTNAVLPHMRDSGRIINVSSLAAMSPYPGASIYAASKAAVEALTRSWAAELAPRGITVNAVAPGLVLTELTESLPVERKNSLVARTMLGRAGQPEDIADVVAFLASNDARWVTGKVLGVDGGVLTF